jgi:hypothetical protein
VTLVGDHDLETFALELVFGDSERLLELKQSLESNQADREEARKSVWVLL